MLSYEVWVSKLSKLTVCLMNEPCLCPGTSEEHVTCSGRGKISYGMPFMTRQYHTFPPLLSLEFLCTLYHFHAANYHQPWVFGHLRSSILKTKKSQPCARLLIRKYLCSFNQMVLKTAFCFPAKYSDVKKWKIIPIFIIWRKKKQLISVITWYGSW